jgi:integrase
MATHQPNRSEWHRSKHGTWARTFGGRGYRVRLFQKRKGGVFYRAVYVPGSNGCDRKALGTSDKAEAEQLAKQLMAALLREDEASPTTQIGVVRPRTQETITLRVLWERYSKECEEFLDNSQESRADAERSVRFLTAVLGAERDVQTISARDVAQYAARRQRGGIRLTLPDKRKSEGTSTPTITGPVRQSSIHHDLATLRVMLRWACRVVTSDGQYRWLERNPLDGLRFQQERSPRRPVASRERYTATQAAIRQLITSEPRPRYRIRWIRLELALFLARSTGRRRGAIAAVQWEDVDFTQHRITWRAEHDKKRVEWVTPMSAAVMDELRQFQRKLGTISGYLFPSKRHPSGHIPADMLGQWLRDAEQRAKLPKLAGGLWHPYRRGWATERMHFPLKAVADAGGWKDVTTLVRCYQQTDEETLLAVMANARPGVTRSVEAGTVAS